MSAKSIQAVEAGRVSPHLHVLVDLAGALGLAVAVLPRSAARAVPPEGLLLRRADIDAPDDEADDDEADG